MRGDPQAASLVGPTASAHDELVHLQAAQAAAMSSAHEDVAGAHAAQAEAAADFRPEAAAEQRQDGQPPRRRRDFPGREAASAQVRRLDEGRRRLGAAAAGKLAPLRSSMQVRSGSKSLQFRSCWRVYSLLCVAQEGFTAVEWLLQHAALLAASAGPLWPAPCLHSGAPMPDVGDGETSSTYDKFVNICQHLSTFVPLTMPTNAPTNACSACSQGLGSRVQTAGHAAGSAAARLATVLSAWFAVAWAWLLVAWQHVSAAARRAFKP